MAREEVMWCCWFYLCLGISSCITIWGFPSLAENIAEHTQGYNAVISACARVGDQWWMVAWQRFIAGSWVGMTHTSSQGDSRGVYGIGVGCPACAAWSSMFLRIYFLCFDHAAINGWDKTQLNLWLNWSLQRMMGTYPPKKGTNSLQSTRRWVRHGSLGRDGCGTDSSRVIWDSSGSKPTYTDLMP